MPIEPSDPDKLEKALPSYPRPRPAEPRPDAGTPSPPRPVPEPPRPQELRLELEYRLETSIRYNQRRRRFFDQFSTLLSVASIVGASGAVATLLAESSSGWRLGLAALLAVAQALNLAVRPDHRAREHARFAGQFIDVERDLHRLPADAAEKAVRRLFARVCEVEREEPPHREVLAAMVANDYAKRVGAPADEFVVVTPWQRRFAHFVDLSPERLRRPSPSR